MSVLTTPDGRYIVVRGRLWRTANPDLSPVERQRFIDGLMEARRDVGRAKRAGDEDGLRQARAAVDRTKRALGERGPVWWLDGAPDLNRKMIANTPYADWHAALGPVNAPPPQAFEPAGHGAHGACDEDRPIR